MKKMLLVGNPAKKETEEQILKKAYIHYPSLGFSAIKGDKLWGVKSINTMTVLG